MAELRFGEPGMYAVAPLGLETKNAHVDVFGTRDGALKNATDNAHRNRSYIVYELREIARVHLPEPVVEFAETVGAPRSE